MAHLELDWNIYHHRLCLLLTLRRSFAAGQQFKNVYDYDDDDHIGMAFKLFIMRKATSKI